MANPHNIKVGQEVFLLRVGHNMAYQSQSYDEQNINKGTVTKIGRLYFTVEHNKNGKWIDTDDFCLDTLQERTEDTRWIRWRFFFNREGIEQLKRKEELHGKVNKFLDKYRYGLKYLHDVSMAEVELWIEHIEKVEALNNEK
jgi:hypothetical protein